MEQFDNLSAKGFMTITTTARVFGAVMINMVAYIFDVIA